MKLGFKLGASVIAVASLLAASSASGDRVATAVNQMKLPSAM
jgi:hypothetical protein